MSYADSVSRKQRLEYLRGMADVEAGMTPEKEDELLRMFDGFDSNDEEHHDPEELRRHGGRNASHSGQKRNDKGKQKELTNEESSGLQGDHESWEMVSHPGHPSGHSESPYKSYPSSTDKKSFGQSSKIEGLGLPGQTKRSPVASIVDELGKELPPTPEQLTALEQGDQEYAATKTISSWTTAPLHIDTTLNTPGLPVPAEEEQKSKEPDLGWPPVEELFADLPDPVTPVFRDEDLTFPMKTIWNRHLFDGSSPADGDAVWDRNDLVASPGPIGEASEGVSYPETVLEGERNTAHAVQAVEEGEVSASVHSSDNDNPPSELLVELTNEDDEDPSVELQAMFKPILDCLKQEYMNTRLLHRHLVSVHKDSLGSMSSTRSSPLVTSANTYPPAPQLSEADDEDDEKNESDGSRERRREQSRERRQAYLAKAIEVREHMKTLFKNRQRVKAVMKLALDCTEKVGEFRERVVGSLNAEQGGFEVSRTDEDSKEGETAREDEHGAQGSSDDIDDRAEQEAEPEHDTEHDTDVEDGSESGLGHMLVIMRGYADS